MSVLWTLILYVGMLSMVNYSHVILVNIDGAWGQWIDLLETRTNCNWKIIYKLSLFDTPPPPHPHPTPHHLSLTSVAGLLRHTLNNNPINVNKQCTLLAINNTHLAISDQSHIAVTSWSEKQEEDQGRVKRGTGEQSKRDEWKWQEGEGRRHKQRKK
jgi:hypothetical protein